MTRILGLAACAIVVTCVAASSSAAVLSYNAILDGPSEFPPNASPGTGTALVDYDDVNHTLRVRATFSGLVGTVTNSHIHGLTTTALTGTAGVITTTPTFPGFPSGVTSGTYDNTLDLTLASSWNPAFVTAQGSIANAEAALVSGLASGKTYFNIHTSFVAAGEIRGFLVPEPATLGLAVVAALGLLRRRRAVR